MDTIGAIRPLISGTSSESRNVEALERLTYLVAKKETALVQSFAGSGLRPFVGELRKQLTVQGMTVAEIHLSGVSVVELPTLFAVELGLMLPPSAGTIQVWLALQSYVQSCRLTASRIAFIVSGIELADELLSPVIDRILTMFDGVIPCLFTARQPVTGVMRSVLSQHVWLRIDVDSLSAHESVQEFTMHLHRLHSDLKLAEDATSAIHPVTKGDAFKLRRLAELAALAAEADERFEIDAETIRLLGAELQPLAG